MFSGRGFKGVAIALTMVTGFAGISTGASAMPFATIGSGQMIVDSPIIEVSTQRRRVVGARPVGPRVVHQRRSRGNNAAVGAAIAIGVLGIAAAAAASQPRRGYYETDNRYYPVDAWGRPIYGARPVQQYEPGYYYYQQQPGYTYQQPAWGGHRAAPQGYYYDRQPAYVDRRQGRGWDRPRDNRHYDRSPDFVGRDQPRGWERQRPTVIRQQPYYTGDRRGRFAPYHEDGRGSGSN